MLSRPTTGDGHTGQFPPQSAAKAEVRRAEAGAFSLPTRDHYERAHARATEALGGSAQAVAAAGR